MMTDINVDELYAPCPNCGALIPDELVCPICEYYVDEDDEEFEDDDYDEE